MHPKTNRRRPGTFDTAAPRAGRGSLTRRSVLAAALLTPFVLRAADYPTKPIRIVIPTPPGSGADILARIIGDPLAASLGQPVVVESKSGASGTIAAGFVAGSLPDGHTLLLTYGVQALTPLAYKRLGYEPFSGFTPIAQLTRVALVAVVPASLGIGSLEEFVTMAKRNRGKLNFASTGKGALNHLLGESLKLDAAVELVHVPYKGGGPAIQAVATGDAHLYFSSYSGVKPLVDAGKLRIIATTGATRLRLLPNVPTAREAGYPGVEAYDWFGVLGPAGLPPAILTTLNRDLGAALERPDVKSKLLELGFELVGGTSGSFTKVIADDHARWAQKVQQAGISFEE